MANNAIMTLVNPAMALVFALAFVAVWGVTKRYTYLLLFALTYALICLGFVLQYITLPIGLPLTRIVANALFLGAAIVLATGIAWRYRRNPPLIELGGIAAGSLVALAWFMFIHPSGGGRILSMNFGLGAIILLIAREIQAAP